MRPDCWAKQYERLSACKACVARYHASLTSQGGDSAKENVTRGYCQAVVTTSDSPHHEGGSAPTSQNTAQDYNISIEKWRTSCKENTSGCLLEEGQMKPDIQGSWLSNRCSNTDQSLSAKDSERRGGAARRAARRVSTAKVSTPRKALPEIMGNTKDSLHGLMSDEPSSMESISGFR